MKIGNLSKVTPLSRRKSDKDRQIVERRPLSLRRAVEDGQVVECRPLSRMVTVEDHRLMSPPYPGG